MHNTYNISYNSKKDKENKTFTKNNSDSFSSMSTINDDTSVHYAGKNIPKQILSFEESNISRRILDNVSYNTPTPIQKQVIPIILENRDLMACAQTGSGKTAAFLLPILDLIYREKSSSYTRYVSKLIPKALILTPTRELAVQIYEEAVKFSRDTHINTTVIYGGTDIRFQLKDLCDRKKNESHILVATPGRLIDLCDRGKIELKNVKYLILDEADRMLDMGFEPQIRDIIEQRDMPNFSNRQTMMFSATFAKNIQLLARNFLKHDYIFISIGRIGSTSSKIRQYIEWAEENEKKSFLLDILDRDPNDLTLIFVETKHCADQLENYLISYNYPAISIHGDKVQYEREDALWAFKSGKKSILVATAVAARGLDIPDVKLVINYDLPTNIDEYVHRIGRTGRAGMNGTAISFFNEKNSNILKGLVDVLNETNQNIPIFLTKLINKHSYNNISNSNKSYIKNAIPQNYDKKEEFDFELNKNNLAKLASKVIKVDKKEIDWFDQK